MPIGAGERLGPTTAQLPSRYRRSRPGGTVSGTSLNFTDFGTAAGDRRKVDKPVQSAGDVCFGWNAAASITTFIVVAERHPVVTRRYLRRGCRRRSRRGQGEFGAGGGVTGVSMEPSCRGRSSRSPPSFKQIPEHRTKPTCQLARIGRRRRLPVTVRVQAPQGDIREGSAGGR